MKKNIITKIIVIVSILFLFCSIDIAASETLTLGIPSKKTALTMLSRWQPIAEEVSRRSGIDIKLIMVKDHDELTEKMTNQEIDLGYYSPVFLVKAQNKLELTPLVMRVKYGSPYYRAGFITKKDSEINELLDLKGKKIALTAKEDSTSGYYIPLSMLRNEEIDFQEDVEIIFTGKHINALKSVVYGSVNVGAIKLYILDDPANSDLVSQIKIISRSFYIPGSSIAAVSTISNEKINLIKDAFLSLSTDPEGLKAIELMNFDGFVLSNNELYNPVRNYLQELN